MRHLRTGLVGLVLLGCDAPAGQPVAAAVDLAAPRRPPAAGPPDLRRARPAGPFPIVLAHGFSGFRNIGSISYFYGVAEALRKDGHQVYVAQLAPYQTSDYRGRQLADFIEQVALPQSGAAQVDIVAHSQGGLDARVAAARLPGKVATVVTLASPHHGSEVADIAAGDLAGPLTSAVAALLDLLGAVEGDSDARAAMAALTTRAVQDFNQRVPDREEVAYFSIAGRSALNPGAGLCNPPTEPAFVAQWDRYLDPLGAELSLAGRIIEENVLPRRPHDGMVSVESARWGTFLGCVPADHLGEVCQLFGAARGGGNLFDCRRLYRDLANWLVERGY